MYTFTSNFCTWQKQSVRPLTSEPRCKEALYTILFHLRATSAHLSWTWPTGLALTPMLMRTYSQPWCIFIHVFIKCFHTYTCIPLRQTNGFIDKTPIACISVMFTLFPPGSTSHRTEQLWPSLVQTLVTRTLDGAWTWCSSVAKVCYTTTSGQVSRPRIFFHILHS